MPHNKQQLQLSIQLAQETDISSLHQAATYQTAGPIDRWHATTAACSTQHRCCRWCQLHLCCRQDMRPNTAPKSSLHQVATAHHNTFDTMSDIWFGCHNRHHKQGCHDRWPMTTTDERRQAATAARSIGAANGANCTYAAFKICPASVSEGHQQWEPTRNETCSRATASNSWLCSHSQTAIAMQQCSHQCMQ